MFVSYIKSALKNIIKNRLYSIINIGGLAIGLTVCILIMLFVRYELSYNNWIPNVENLYSLEATFPNSKRPPNGLSQSPEAKMVEVFPEILSSSRVYRNRGNFSYGDKTIWGLTREVDPKFFDLFDLQMVSGNRAAGLDDNLSMLLSEDAAKKYFGTEDPLGKILVMNKERNYKIAGVFKNLPRNTHLYMQMIVLFDPARYVEKPGITQSRHFTYLKLKEGVDPLKVVEQFSSFIDNNIHFQKEDTSKAYSDYLKFSLRSLSDIHLYFNRDGVLVADEALKTVYTFSAIALLILIIASLNFMNLSIAQSLKRAREVSLRKVLGSTRSQLITQFLSESILVTSFGLLFAIVLAELSLPFFTSFIGKDLTLNFLADPLQIISILGFAVVVGLFSGLYPAFFLSSFRPSKVLKSNNSTYEGGGKIRNVLVIFQFSISISLIIATLVIYGQMLFAKSMDKGFDIENKVQLSAHSEQVKPVMNTLKQEMLNLPGVLDLTLTYAEFPPTLFAGTSITRLDDFGSSPKRIGVRHVGPNFLNFYGIAPIAGQSFRGDSSDFPKTPSDVTQPIEERIIVNKAFLKEFGFGSAEEAIGKVFVSKQGRNVHSTIIGVIDNLHTQSLRRAVDPMITRAADLNVGYINLALNPTMAKETRTQVKAIWKTHLPDVNLFYDYVVDNYEYLYRNDEKKGKMVAAFSIFAVLISCVGLFALASFAAEQRTKEIGLRKVLGAEVKDIIKLLVWQFSKPVIVANIVAWPLSWYFMNDWLNGFQYRIPLGVEPFILAGIIALLIAWGTVIYRSNKVARTNPIKALRYE